MAQTIYTKALVEAAETHGSTQALASFLHVPENTLLRWMAGRAQMPLQAFLKVIEFLARHEKTQPAPAPVDGTPTEQLKFSMGQLEARCARCDSAEFALATPGPLRYTSALACSSCGERVIHGDLVCRLARDAVQTSRAMTAARSKRRGAAKPTAPTRSIAKS